MARENRYRQFQPRQQRWRRSHHPHGEEYRLQRSERDRFETGGERRYQPAWEDRAYEGDLSYLGGGYPEEFGYRRKEEERGPPDYRGREEEPQRFRSYDERIQGAFGPEEEPYGRAHYDPNYLPYYGPSQGSPYTRGGFTGERLRGYGDRMRWQDEREPGYFGTGGATGVSGSVAGTRALGPSGYLGGGADIEEWMQRSDAHPGAYGERPSFRGRGPKGYRRSDERLKEMACERLTDDPYIDASDVSVDVRDQVVKLTGTVDDRRTKYRIEDAIEHLGGIQDIDNQLRVQSAGGRAQQGEPGEERGTSGGVGRKTAGRR